jgi:tetratricopeptide (TPR) repeat protein
MRRARGCPSLLFCAIALILTSRPGLAQSGGGIQYSDTDRRYYEAWGLSTEDPEAYLLFANEMSQAGRFTTATAYFREALRLRPDYLPAHFGYGMLLLAEQKWEEALPHLKPVADSTELKAPQACSRVARIYGRQGNKEMALHYFARAVELAPTQPAPRFNYANALRNQHRTEEAIVQFEKVFELEADPSTSRLAHLKLAEIYVERGQPENAIRQLESMLEVDPNDALVHYDLAIALEAIGDGTAAFSHYEQAMANAKGPGYRNLRRKIRLRMAQP